MGDMRRVISFLLLTMISMSALSAQRKKYPDEIIIEGERLHVQGIALDVKKNCLYASFTSAFFKTNMQGNVVGSITGINGHLGAMTFDPESRKVYASLEKKGDAIGRGVSDAIGASRHKESQSRFYIAEIDVDKIKKHDTPFDKAVRLYEVSEAVKDYLATVEVDGKALKHRYGCSGIDGITIGPRFGDKSSEDKCLYVAYGVYGDTLRCDNDHNILLAYRLDDLEKPEHKFFIHTGNTRYGVQNLAYDKHTERLYMAVYRGRKAKYPNYRLFALDVNQKPYKAPLKDVPYHDGDAEQLDVCGGWNFRWGSTGLCPLGDGRYYISHNYKKDGRQMCKVTMYVSGDEKMPFIKN